MAKKGNGMKKVANAAKKVVNHATSAAKNAGKNLSDGFKDMLNVSKNMGNSLVDVYHGKQGAGANFAKEAIGYAGRTIGRTFDVIKGLFNDAKKWYSYQGKVAELAYNETRPYNPKNVRTMKGSSADPYSPGVGATHYIVNNIKWQDIYGTEAFDLATAEAFRAMRNAIRSNLPYSITQFRSYVKAVISLIAVSKSIEKLLGWYPIVRQDIPELHDAILHVPANYDESGFLKPTPIDILADDDKYAAALNRFKMLKNYCRQIRVPKKMVEYISWWVGGTFIDQSAPNPQIYSNILRDCPIYTMDANGDTLQLGVYDVLNVDIDVVIKQASTILSSCGVMNADLMKAEAYDVLQLVEPDEYKATAMDDAEFFNALINSYNFDQDFSYGVTSVKTEFCSPEYIRVDFLPVLSRDDRLGAALAVAKYFGAAAPFSIQSQAAYFDVGGESYVPHNITGTIPNFDATTQIIPVRASTTESYYLQITGVMHVDSTLSIAVSNSAKTTMLTYNQRYTAQSTPTLTSATLYTARTWELFRSTRSSAGVCLGKGSTGYLNLMFDNQNMSMYYGCSSPYTLDGTQVSVTLPGVTLSLGTAADGTSIYTAKCTNGTMSAISNAGLQAAIFDIFKANGVIYIPAVLYSFSVTYTVTSNTLGYEVQDAAVASLFCEQVDYHMPIVMVNDIIVQANTSGLYKGARFRNNVTLLKECYVPVTLSKDNTLQTINQMLLGLFSM